MKMTNWTHSVSPVLSLFEKHSFVQEKKSRLDSFGIKILDVLVGMLLLQEWKFFQVLDSCADSVRIVQ